jgi:hypothetical protein
MMFPATNFQGLGFSFFSVSLNSMETILRFNFYELRTLYLYHMLVIVEHVGNYLRFLCDSM